MDSEKFDKVVLDLLYDDLDELTRASAIRHLEQSGRARALYSELRATREVGALPLVEPPADLEHRILEAEARARAGRPLGQRLGTLVSIVASYTMRPQLGMAALLLLMLGSSLLFLRVKPGAPRGVMVTERGVPESERETVAVVPAPSALPAAPAEAPSPAQHAARARAGGDAPRAEPPPADKIARADTRAAARSATGASLDGYDEGMGAAAAPMAQAAPAPAAPAREAADLATEKKAATSPAVSGCAASLPHYEEVRANPTSPSAGYAATWAAAECYREQGSYERARSAYTSLLGVPAYDEQARRALADLPPRVAGTVAPVPNATAKAAAKASATAPSP